MTVHDVIGELFRGVGMLFFLLFVAACVVASGGGLP